MPERRNLYASHILSRGKPKTIIVQRKQNKNNKLLMYSGQGARLIEPRVAGSIL